MRTVLAPTALVVLLAACGGGPGHAATGARALPDPACRVSVVPTGMSEDVAHSGAITAAEYSPSGDVQAALVYDQFQAGQRSVYTDLGAGAAKPALVTECTDLRFGSARGASHFLGSWSDLRQQAGSLARPLTPPVTAGSRVLGYSETGQGFAGYGIASTDVIELAALSGPDVFTVAVASAQPSLALAARLLSESARS